ncbi:MAG: hypothetical protein DRH56_03500, partial [Deltaproteobacteria bacterium]
MKGGKRGLKASCGSKKERVADFPAERRRMMGPCAFIFKESAVPLWGLSSRRRLERVLRRAGITDFTEDPGSVPAGRTVLLIRGDYLYDDRVINALVETPGVLLTTDPAG